MNLHLDHDTARRRDERRNLWRDNRIWWVNCLAIEKHWFYGGAELQAARGRRDALLAALLENW